MVAGPEPIDRAVAPGATDWLELVADGPSAAVSDRPQEPAVRATATSKVVADHRRSARLTARTGPVAERPQVQFQAQAQFQGPVQVPVLADAT